MGRKELGKVVNMKLHCMEFSKSKFIILFNILVGAILYLKVEYSLKNIRIFIFAS